MTYLRSLSLHGKELQFPAFFPDATRGVIRSLDAVDLTQTKTEGLIVNTYHLMSQPGTGVIKSFGGIKQFMGWNGFVISDSGGFQVLSMIYRNKGFGKISDEGVTFLRGSKGGNVKYKFSPEKCIQVQFQLNPDIMICLDDCPQVHATDEENKKSVERTIQWAKRCKVEFEKQCIARKHTDETRPLLFGVIQGGNDYTLRKQCAEALQDIGFDGFGFGGWPLNKEGVFDFDLLSYTASLMPDHLPKYALGVGDPLSVVACTQMGYNIFDCVLPTRDARHKRLYVLMKDPKEIDIQHDKRFCGYTYIKREAYIRDNRPISEYCDCFACTHYSRGYLHHLFKIEDTLALRLATIHNIRTYTLVIDILRKHVNTTKY